MPGRPLERVAPRAASAVLHCAGRRLADIVLFERLLNSCILMILSAPPRFLGAPPRASLRPRREDASPREIFGEARHYDIRLFEMADDYLILRAADFAPGRRRRDAATGLLTCRYFAYMRAASTLTAIPGKVLLFDEDFITLTRRGTSLQHSPP